MNHISSSFQETVQLCIADVIGKYKKGIFLFERTKFHDGEHKADFFRYNDSK